MLVSVVRALVFPVSHMSQIRIRLTYVSYTVSHMFYIGETLVSVLVGGGYHVTKTYQIIVYYY